MDKKSHVDASPEYEDNAYKNEKLHQKKKATGDEIR